MSASAPLPAEGVEEAGLVGEDDRLCAVAQLELLQQAGDVRPSCR